MCKRPLATFILELTKFVKPNLLPSKETSLLLSINTLSLLVEEVPMQ